MLSRIPTIRGAPVLGCLPELQRDRLGLLMRAYREGGDIAAFPVLNRRVVVVTSPEHAGVVLRKHASSFRKFVALNRYSRPITGEGLLTAEGDVHRRQRKLVAPGLTRREVGTYADTMARIIDAHAARWRDGATLDVHAEMAALTLEVACETMFSTTATPYVEAVGDAVRAGLDFIAHRLGSLVPLPLWLPIPQHRRMKRGVAVLDRVVYGIIAERRAGAARDDILGMLLAARDEDDDSTMTDLEVRDQVMTLLVAGHDTTANLLTWALHLLSRHDDVAERLRAEAHGALGGRPPTLEDLPKLPYALQVLKEAMRLYPPAYMVGRESTEPVAIGGYELPANTTVLVNIYGLHRRPDLFPDPERFDPERFTPEAEQALPRGAFLPFVDGPRVCIGNHFALMEGQIALAHLAQRARLHPVGAPLDVRPEPRVTLRPSTTIHLRVATEA